MAAYTPRIHVGIGGWNYAEWRGGAFYPAGLPQAQELHYASRALTGLEVNATFYSTQKPATYARWRDETPEGFVFAVKAHRLATQRKTLAEGAEAVVHFLESGVTELRDRLGPIVWQFPPFRRFDADDVECFLALLPDAVDGLPLRHVLEPRHASFACADYVRLARSYGVATVYTDSPDYPNIADPTADFVTLGSCVRNPAKPRATRRVHSTSGQHACAAGNRAPCPPACRWSTPPRRPRTPRRAKCSCSSSPPSRRATRRRQRG